MTPRLLVCLLCAVAGAAEPVLTYDRPATHWERERLPIGNGRLGAMLDGGVGIDRIQFNEESLWTGDANPSGGFDYSKDKPNSFGAYQNFGEVVVTIDGADGKPVPDGYERRLELLDGIHLTLVPGQGLREAFASVPAQVAVLRYRFERQTSGTVELRQAHGNPVRAVRAALVTEGRFTNGLEFAAKAQVLAPRGGKVSETGATLRFEQCSELLIILGARTNYLMDPAKAFKGSAPLPRLEAEVEAAAAKGFAALHAEHVAEHSAWMRRVDVAWGVTAPAVAVLPTDKRLALYAKGGADPELEATLYQYGRYLLIGSSRPGCLPANLQGIWNESNNPAWASDYHSNINLQMCYWLAEVTNLSECHVPLTDWIIASVPGFREATRADAKRFGANVRGWTARTSQNIWGGNGWEWNLPGNAWLVQHAWEHYVYTLDKEFLRTKTYPLLKEVCEFWIDHLKVLPDGRLVVPDGWSPEQGPREDGVTYDQQIVWDLFQNTIEASEALGVDDAFRQELKLRQAKLVGPQVGRWGQLMEWMVDRDDPNNQHRHTSHLFAVYPGRQISVQRTPELAAAAMKSLDARGSVGDSRRSWTWAWRSALWARFGKGDRVAEMIRGLMTHNMLPNLFANHPPFQLDGNYGIVAGISEALVQSHAGEIVLLPALPKSWAEGHANGLRARGSIEIKEMSWKAGRLERAVLVSSVDQTVAVRVNGEVRQVTLKAGQPAEVR